MVKKFLYIFEFLILACIFFMAGHLLSISKHPPLSEELQLLEFQKQYNQTVKNDLENLLETLVGPGNAKAFVQIDLKKSKKTTQEQKGTPYNKTTTFNTTQGIVVDQQHISLILNNSAPFKIETYQHITESALGINHNLGDTLSIEILPFYQYPFLTFGLSRLVLIRLAGIIGAVFCGLVILLVFVYLKETNALINKEFLSGDLSPVSPDTISSESLNFFLNLSKEQKYALFRHLNKKTLVFALQTTSLKIHEDISKILPVSDWKEICDLYNKTPYSFTESQEAKKKIINLYVTLKEQKVL